MAELMTVPKELIERLLKAHLQSTVDWDAMRALNTLVLSGIALAPSATGEQPTASSVEIDRFLAALESVFKEDGDSIQETTMRMIRARIRAMLAAAPASATVAHQPGTYSECGLCGAQSFDITPQVWTTRERLAAAPASAEPVQEAGSDRDWTEDAEHENGNYPCSCVNCGFAFEGHKRRVICKRCAAPIPAPAEPVQGAVGEVVAGGTEFHPNVIVQWNTRVPTGTKLYAAPRVEAGATRCFMDGVDWQHELGCAAGGTRLYGSAEEVKEETKCWPQCGIVEVEVRLVQWIADQNFDVQLTPDMKSDEKVKP